MDRIPRALARPALRPGILIFNVFLWTASAAVPAKEAAGETGDPIAAGGGRRPAAAERLGPFPVRNLHPLTLPFYEPLAERADVLPPWRFTLQTFGQYGNVQRADRKGNDLATFDGEFLRLSFFLRLGLAEGLEALAEIPFHARGSGMFDDVIKGFHDITNITRDDRDSFEFDQVLVIDDEEVFSEGSTGLELADISLQLKYRILDEDVHPFGLAVRGGIEFPTGREATWIGSGEIDTGIGAIAQKSVGDFTFYCHLDYRFLSRPDRLEAAGIGVRPAPKGAAAVEWRAFRWIGFVLQFDVAENPFKGADLKPFRKPQALLSFGIHVRAGDRFQAQLGLVEDLVPATSADIAAFLGCSYSF